MEDATLTYRAGWGGGCHFNIQGREGVEDAYLNIQGREGVEDASLTYRAGRGWRMPP